MGDTWWFRIHVAKAIPRYVPPMERLVAQCPDMFEPACSEAPGPGSKGDTQASAAGVIKVDVESAPMERCPLCKEKFSPQGWGNPSCVMCSGVEDMCLPIDENIFGNILRMETSADAKKDED